MSNINRRDKYIGLTTTNFNNLIVTRIYTSINEVLTGVHQYSDDLINALMDSTDSVSIVDLLAINPKHHFESMFSTSSDNDNVPSYLRDVVGADSIRHNVDYNLPLFLLDINRFNDELNSIVRESDVVYSSTIDTVYEIKGYKVIDDHKNTIAVTYFNTIRDSLDEKVSGYVINRNNARILSQYLLQNVYASTLVPQNVLDKCIAMMMEINRMINDYDSLPSIPDHRETILHNVVNAFLQTSMSDYLFNKYDIDYIANSKSDSK